MGNIRVVVRGGGDMGTGVAHRLYKSGFCVTVLEIEQPVVIRRKVAFAQAVFDGQVVVENVKAVKAAGSREIEDIVMAGAVPVLVDPNCTVLQDSGSDVFIDATLSKKNTGVHRDMAPITIALGPGFKAGEDVDAVIETNRGHALGKVIYEGYAEPNTGVPEAVKGYTEERVLRAPCDGIVRNAVEIGNVIRKSDVVCCVDKTQVLAAINGVLRGVIREGMQVKRGLKIGDIDPRGVKEYCCLISDKARAVAGGVLEAILHLKKTEKL